MSRIFLIGFMGSGKSTLGKQLGLLLQYEFLDLDDWVEKKEGVTISQLFSSKGENYFREKESFYLKSLGEKQDVIVATGGGTPCYFDNMEWMNRSGITVYLRVSPEELFHRLKKEKDHRPLLAGKTDSALNEFIRTKLKEREHIYLLSKSITEAEGMSGEQLYKELSDQGLL